MVTKVQRLHEKAVIPTKGTEKSTGYDITMIRVDKIVDDVIFFGTGLSIQPPEGYYFEIAPRSSISKLPLALANSIGFIDEDYRGELIIPVRVMHSDQGRGSQQGTSPNGIVHIFGAKPPSMMAVANRILAEKPVLFQLILRERLETEWEESNDLTETHRGSGGFGSTDGQRRGVVKRVT